MYILFRIIDKFVADGVPITHSKYRHSSLRGDIIHIVPDSVFPTENELTNPEWRIIKVSGLLQSEIDALLDREPISLDPESPKTYRWRRYRRLDLDNILLSGPIADWLSDNTRVQPILDLSTNAELIRNIVKTRGNADDWTA